MLIDHERKGLVKSILQELTRRVQAAVDAVAGEGDAAVRPAQDEQFGDYQSNCAMALAKKLGKKPRDIAQAIADKADLAGFCAVPEIAGPGFINFRIDPAYLAAALSKIPPGPAESGARLGLPRATHPVVAVVDLSSPNLAKEMHVGHLRSTVIGDCVARVLEFDGHTVIRENHVGDWGTQFGMLVAYIRRVKPQVVENPRLLEINDLESFYVQAKALFDADEAFKTEARDAVVALQRGDAATRLIWKAFCDESLRHCHAILQRLGVKVTDRGESFYQDLMDDVICRLEAKRAAVPDGPVRDSAGALCIFMDGFTTREGAPLPLIVRKTDGGFNYATSDLATILHRVETLNAARIVYVVGITQKQHFEMVFAAARKVGFVAENVRMEHLGFGSILSATGRPFKTREGGTVKLATILDEAVDRARRVLTQRAFDDDRPQREFSSGEIENIAETVGLAAVRYYDLAHAITSDYKFDVDTMLALEGNTAPYMLYAYARVRSIGRKAGLDFDTFADAIDIILEHPAEIALAKKLLQLPDVLAVLVRELRPNLLTDYLYDLSKAFNRFYDKKLGVRVIDAAPEPVRISRLRLCDLTARTLKLGLNLLGIETLEQM